MKQMLRSLLLAAAAFVPALSGAQTTGNFDTTVSFAGGSRAVSVHVPTSYTPATKYRLMVCLHGLGDTCTNYRNALVSNLNLSANFPNTILVCPESSDKNQDYYATPGGEAIIQQSISMAMAKYHVDTANVVLQGFSLGGRAALRYGLDHTATFKGLLLNTPAIQGVKEAVNGQPGYPFAYANAANIPVYMTHGASDMFYTSSLDSTYEKLVRANGKVRFFRIAGLGHAIPPVAQIRNFPDFFNTPAKAGIDAEAVLFKPVPFLSCNAPATAQLLFRNTSQVPLQSVKFRYTLGGQTQTGTWQGNLQPFQHALFNATFNNAVAGDNPVTITIDTLNGVVADSIAANNQQAGIIHFAGASLTLVDEGFEGATFPPAGWALEEGGDFYTAWGDDNSVKKTGTKSVTAFNTILFFDNAGRKEGLITPPIAIAASAPQLRFDVAYNYHRYTPPYLLAVTDFTDTLEVLVSTDCGNTWSSLYKKGGATLATFANPITNALSVQAAFINPADSNWRRETISLGSLAGATAARFKFSYRSGLGGHIALDNVRIASTAGVGPEATAMPYRIYPNPADGMLQVEGAEGCAATLTNTMGQVMFRQNLTAPQSQLDMTRLVPGMYFLAVTNAAGDVYKTQVLKR